MSQPSLQDLLEVMIIITEKLRTHVKSFQQGLEMVQEQQQSPFGLAQSPPPPLPKNPYDLAGMPGIFENSMALQPAGSVSPQKGLTLPNQPWNTSSAPHASQPPQSQLRTPQQILAQISFAQDKVPKLLADLNNYWHALRDAAEPICQR